MAIVTTLDVACDYGDCPTWGEGVSGRGGWVTATRARAAARGYGFVRRRVEGHVVDLCPEHAATEDLGEHVEGPAFDPDAKYETVTIFDIAGRPGDKPRDTP